MLARADRRRLVSSACRRAALLAAAIAGIVAWPGVSLGMESPACPRVPVPPLALPKLRAALAPGAGSGGHLHGGAPAPLTIVALGSSSTSGAGASSPDAAYPARLEAILRAARPDLAIRVANRGRGGEQAEQMVARLESDVLSERPALVIWQAGANGALRRADPARFRAAVATGIARLREAGAEVVLMDNQRAPRIEAASEHARFDAALAGLAATTPGVALFSRGRLMDAWAAAGVPPGAMLVGDGVHHNDRGYACLAAALAEALLGSRATSPPPSPSPPSAPFGDSRVATAPH